MHIIQSANNMLMLMDSQQIKSIGRAATDVLMLQRRGASGVHESNKHKLKFLKSQRQIVSNYEQLNINLLGL